MRFIVGKARSGKTARIISEIKETVIKGQGRALLLIPEQYSHEAERELCTACGDRLSLYAEVMSFSGFARWGRSVYGGCARRWMDNGGKLLCMAVALRELKPLLHLYGDAAENPDLLAAMVQEVDTLKAADIGSAGLRKLSETLDGELSIKLSELAGILETYEYITERSGATAKDPLALLAEQIEKHGLTEFDRVYVDGFLDFTGLEFHVLSALLKREIDLTVCLPCGEENRADEHLLISKITKEKLTQVAQELGQTVDLVTVESNEAGSDTLAYFTEHMFDYAVKPADPEPGRFSLMLADTPAVECEAAAAEVLHAVRDEGLRWRDVAVAIRGFSDYRGLLENTFRRYGIPLFVTRKDLLSEKALPNWITCAYELVLGNWDVDDMTAYLRCGFSGLSEEECDSLCSYLYLWQLNSAAWLRPGDWEQHPDGYGKPRNEETDARLKALNLSRRHVAAPLLLLKKRIAAAKTAADQAQALLAFLDAADIRGTLQKRIRDLEAEGNSELKAEYLQLWDIITSAIQQTVMILGSVPMDGNTYYRLFRAVLTSYDIGMIPVSLDRVSAGDFDRMRRRKIRRLIVMGCCDGRLPPERGGGGLFTQDERDLLAEHGLTVGGGDGELWREYALIYHTLSLPHEKLILSCPETGFNGEALTPALVFTLAQKMFGLDPQKANPQLMRLNAAVPAMGLALTADAPQAGEAANAAEQWFREHEPERLQRLKNAVNSDRGCLSAEAVAALYGKRMRISPSRLESFSSCRFHYFCKYGMKAEPTEPAGFHPPEIGTFIHYILENVVRSVKEQGGFDSVSDEELREITSRQIEEYIRSELLNYAEKSARFRWLFERLCEEVYRIVQDTADELRSSDFEPLSFELDMSKLNTQLDCGEAGKISLTGIADRVDGFSDENGLHLRVVDYKTGKKQFQLSDVLYGRNLQMLLYLFAVCDNAAFLYHSTAVPSGIEYLPARESMLHFKQLPDAEEETKERRKEKRRSGLILSDPSVVSAWEHGNEKQYMPQKSGTKNPFVSMDQLNILRCQAEQCLREMAETVASGTIDANPVWKSESDNACRNCPYLPVCRFEEGENGEASRTIRNLPDAEVWNILDPKDSDGADSGP